MLYSIVKKGNSKAFEGFWVIIEKRNDNLQHAVLYTTKNILDTEIEVPFSLRNIVEWEPSGEQTLKLNLKKISNSGNWNSKINFGIYKGYQIGLIYAFDIGYLEWLILNVDSFFISDLKSLQKFGVFRQKRKYKKNIELGVGSLDKFMQEFNSIQELSSEINILNRNIFISSEAQAINSSKQLLNNYQ